MPAEEFVHPNKDEKPKSKNGSISLSESPAITEKNVDDILFDMFKDADGKVAVGKFLSQAKYKMESENNRSQSTEGYDVTCALPCQPIKLPATFRRSVAGGKISFN
ncbi:hypothetical protein AVEN_262253-1 [Araneus ventricosus]|uniref:Uncharacterized protein n=1 Tax=Araneus ventricosus TaxID=182803 RepID=A0A4Y2QVL1_ARAVE|nr:hypothetical protein AVEN_262253-1 [Araneus ventricosus]